MADKNTSGGMEPARKEKGDLKDLPDPSQELTEGQAEAVKGGKVSEIVVVKSTDATASSQ
jgi:hypothetical protein